MDLIFTFPNATVVAYNVMHILWILTAILYIILGCLSVHLHMVETIVTISTSVMWIQPYPIEKQFVFRFRKTISIIKMSASGKEDHCRANTSLTDVVNRER